MTRSLLLLVACAAGCGAAAPRTARIEPLPALPFALEDGPRELETAWGAARLARESGYEPATLREQVTSKGGTTAAALAVLDAAGVRDMVSRAVGAATARSRELAQEFGAQDGAPPAVRE